MSDEHTQRLDRLYLLSDGTFKLASAHFQEPNDDGHVGYCEWKARVDGNDYGARVMTRPENAAKSEQTLENLALHAEMVLRRLLVLDEGHVE